MAVRIAHTQSDLAPFARGVCVPTMGALHAGHAVLVRFARECSGGHRPVVVTIFVNPTQFGPNEDFIRYPRTLEADLKVCEEAGGDVVFAPDVEVIYPTPQSRVVDVHAPLPAVATEPGLEDASRPTFFSGVCQVVRRLFELVDPATAIFGEKDYQQLLTIRAMVAMFNLPIEVIGRPTVRDSDGLAMSSRNAYLGPPQRQRALGLSRSLHEAQSAGTPAEAEKIMRTILLAHQVEIDYAVVRDAQTLERIERYESGHPARALIAGRVGMTRLIDNAPIGLKDGAQV